jgi:hypothetical protein
MPDGTTLTIAIPVMGVDPNTGRCLGQLRDEAGALIATSCFAASPVTVTGTSVFQGFGRLQIFDIRDPANPVKLSTFGTPNSNDVNVALTERLATPLRFFTANYIDAKGKEVLAGWESDGLRIIDISRPQAPVEIAAWMGEGTAPGTPPVRGWQVVRHRNLILLNSLFAGVHILTADHRH